MAPSREEQSKPLKLKSKQQSLKLFVSTGSDTSINLVESFLFIKALQPQLAFLTFF